MRPSPADEVRKLYESTAESYAEMMDAEIELPVYADVLGRLQSRITDLTGAIVDTACGSGHMLSMFQQKYDQDRALLGVDLSPRMVAIAQAKLGASATVSVGDMRDLSSFDSESCCAILNFFALHHLDSDEARSALREWRRVLEPGGQLVVATWEGCGAIDYGDDSDIVALRYGSDELASWAAGAGFSVSRCVVEPVDGFPMDVVYLEAHK